MNFLETSKASFPLLSLIIFSPLLGVLLLFLVPREKEGAARSVAMFSTALTFILSVLLFRGFNPEGGFQFAEDRVWYASLGARYTVAVDGLSFWFVLLTTFLTFLVTLASGSIHHKTRAYLASILLLEVGMLGAFLAIDVLAFYVFWELMLIPMYFLIGIWGGKRRVYAAIKFVLYTAFGSLLMLVAIAYLSFKSASLGASPDLIPSFNPGDWMRLPLSHKEELLLFSAFALAFAIKVPVFPLHTWLPDAHVEAPTGGSVILAGVLLKMGLYGLLRFCVPLFPNAVQEAAPLFALLGVIGIVFGALVAWVQTDMKKLVAYSSVSHLGFCVLGFATLNIEGVQGSVIQMLNHGVSTAALFFLVGVLYDRKHTRMIADYSGLAAKVPAFAILFLIFSLSSIGLPLTNGFVGEFLIMLGAFRYNPYLAAIASTGVILAAIYMLSLYRRVMFGPMNGAANADLTDVTSRERLVFAPLLILVFVMGLWPQIFLKVMDPTLKSIINANKTKDIAFLIED